MEYTIILVIAAIIVVGVILVRRRRKQNSLLDYHIHLCIPFAVPPRVDEETVIQQFKSKWEAEVACGEAQDLGAPQEGVKTYLMANGIHNVRLMVSRVPLPSDLVSVTIDGAPGLESEDQTALRNHKGYISIDYFLGPPDDAVARVRFVAQTLVSLVGLDSALGYVNVSAMSYRPRSQVETVLNRPELEPTGLYLLFANTHIVEEDGTTWLHTHGLEQFGLPDLQTRFTDPTGQRYHWELISNAAGYMIERGPILQPGHTAELLGDGVIYRIRAANEEPDHPFGSFGCLEIVRK